MSVSDVFTEIIQDYPGNVKDNTNNILGEHFAHHNCFENDIIAFYHDPLKKMYLDIYILHD